MGEVWRAIDTKLDREVALKILPDALAQSPDRLARFAREAKVLAALNHPNIAQIYGVEDRALVMELVAGETIHGPLPVETALHYARQIADALEAAHEKGIVHRDLKPANIMVTAQGVIKVLDFGLAKSLARAATGDPENSPTLTIDETQPGTVMGTAPYMAPEQVRGQAVDSRADIWAFGVVLYEMLAGKRAFTQATAADLASAVLGQEPDWSAIPAATPARVQELLRLCLAKDRKMRLQAVGDVRIFLTALTAFAAPLEVTDTSRERLRRQLLPWAVAGLLALMAALGWWAPWRNSPAATNRPYLQMELETGNADVSQPAISADGMRVVFVSKGSLSIRRLDQGSVTPLAGTEGASSPFFSPDGLWVAFFSHRKLQKIAVEGGAAVTLCDAPNFGGGSWGDDNQIVAILNPDAGLVLVNAGGGSPQPLSNLKADSADTPLHFGPQILPGGKGILYGASDGSWQGSLRVFTPHNGIKTLVENSTHGRYLAGGYLVYHQRGTLFAAPMDLGRLELTGPAVPLVDGVSYRTTHADFDLSASGTLVYYRGTGGANLVPSWLYSSGKIEALPLKPGNYLSPRVSPDGKRLALAVIAEGKQNLWVYDLSREIFTRLTSTADPDLLPAWTPDGEYLAFQSGRTLAWLRSDGGGKLERLAGFRAHAAPWSFSSDGKWLALWPLGPGSDLWIAPVERPAGALQFGQPQPLLQQPGSKGAPAISPDGRWLAYTSDESGAFQIYVIPFAPQGTTKGGKWQLSNEGGLGPIWSHNGRDLFYLGLDQQVMVAAYGRQGDSFLAEKPRFWSARPLGDSGFLSGFDVAPDGTRVLALLTAEDAKPETFLRLLLNVGSELRRRGGAGGR